MLHRAPRCLNWTRQDYIAMESPQKIVDNPPQIDAEALYRFEVGNEPAPERFAGAASGAILVEVAGSAGNAALEAAAKQWKVIRKLEISSGASDSPLHLMNHMALKLALNTISTGTMARLGRVAGNWMSWVSTSNKKLIDRRDPGLGLRTRRGSVPRSVPRPLRNRRRNGVGGLERPREAVAGSAYPGPAPPRLKHGGQRVTSNR